MNICRFCDYYSPESEFCAVNPNLLGHASECSDYQEISRAVLSADLEDWMSQASIYQDSSVVWIVDFCRNVATHCSQETYTIANYYGDMSNPTKEKFAEFRRESAQAAAKKHTLAKALLKANLI